MLAIIKINYRLWLPSDTHKIFSLTRSHILSYMRGFHLNYLKEQKIFWLLYINALNIKMGRRPNLLYNFEFTYLKWGLGRIKKQFYFISLRYSDEKEVRKDLYTGTVFCLNGRKCTTETKNLYQLLKPIDSRAICFKNNT